jgi:LemA protein
VTDYNNGIEQFPLSIFANMLGYQRKEVFVIPEVERQNLNARQLFGEKLIC